ncbi:hypothetical protein [Clostridium sp. FP1]|uniref:hypothetical protein n=1 Tax=Clostridium sp. FP1 TaxID=2724076 RepID=UPI0013E91CE6|nr:hypothetical protein [Clostridium sp. FP1]MBZ9633042.1 hypothetical protein [Clostridium sp. FP1]
MKITAEFNSNEELLSFIGAFGTKSFIPSQGVANITNVVTPVVETKKVVKNEDVKKEDKPVTEIKAPKEENKEETKVTKEMVRERLGAIMKAGKQAEVKALVALHGASKLPDLKEEEYAAVYEEAEALL